MKRIFIFLIDIYKLFFSLILEFLFGKGCRFSPTCSQYAKEAIERFGVIEGSVLSIKRLIRCNPLSRLYYDPVPTK